MSRSGQGAGKAPRRTRYRCVVNYLAHVYLARHDDEAMLGALLGDFVGTADLHRYSATMQGEILLHRKIDSYTDRHPAVASTRALFPEGRRRFAGIALDVYFDHLLARAWPAYSEVALDAFAQRFYATLRAHHALLPERLKQIAPHMAAHDWFGAYRDRDSVDRAVRRIATRLSRRGDALVDCLPLLRRHETEIDTRFAAFFPDLQDYVATLREGAGVGSPAAR